MNKIVFPIALAVALVFAASSAALGEVRAYEKEVAIPTWEIGPPEVHPSFPDAGRDIYPYTLNDVLMDRKVDKTYHAVFLENEYIRLLILPEIGGRLHGAIDKTNDYVWIYWQRTIKPGLISMTGAWISGGIEWNFPHGHRPSCFQPVDHRIVHHGDGSATVWVGETEPIFRMRWLVGMTVFPGRSYMRCDYLLINPTNHRHSFQFWATSATHANEWAQAQYPGDMVTGHGKHQFWNWPVHDGVDLTWWKNSPNASSYFAFNNPSDWFGTYDHRARGGMVHVADHHIMPGKKLWTWGSGPSGRIWEDILSDGGGPYFEPQAGAWSDNQPDYHWIEPGEVKTAHDYWYPIRDTRGFRNANRDLAVNVDLSEGKAFAAVYSTAAGRKYRVVLKNAKTGTVLADKVVDIAPDHPFTVERPAGSGTTVYDLRLSVLDPRGKPRIELQRRPPRKVELPEGFHDPGDPAGMNQDELLHAGEWLDRFRRTEKAMTYYRRALEKDPGDTRVNIEMAFLHLKQGRWNEALRHLDRALERNPDNARVYYGQGLAYCGRGDLDKAYRCFYRATYSPAFHSIAYLNLARLDLRRGEPAIAIAKLREAAASSGKFADIPALEAAAFRRAGKHREALRAAEAALRRDPLHFMGGYEEMAALRNLERPAASAAATWKATMRGAVQNYLELSLAYAAAGLFGDAEKILEVFASDKDPSAIHPMVNYYRGWFRELTGDAAGAASFRSAARKGPVDYTLPHRLEGQAALESALRKSPGDAHARLFLGDLLYARGQREEALAHWKEAVRIDAHIAHAWRNVAYAQRHLEHDLDASLAAYTKCLELRPRDARVLLEQDEVAEALGVPPARRLAVLEKHRDIALTRDDLLSRWIDLELEAGGSENLERVHHALSTHHFHSWEGGYEIHHAWVEVNQKLGDLALAAGKRARALRHYEDASTYPENLEVAARTPDFRAHVNWNLARFYLAGKHAEKAKVYLEEILAEKYSKCHLGTYYQALAAKAMGEEARSKELLERLEARARKLTSGKYEYRGTPETIGRYLLSLTLEARGEKEAAAAERKQALARDPRVRRSAIREAQLDIARAHQ